MFVTVVDLGGAGFMGGTVMDDIITTGGADVPAGTVFTTTAELVLAGSEKTHQINFSKVHHTYISIFLYACTYRKNPNAPPLRGYCKGLGQLC